MKKVKIFLMNKGGVGKTPLAIFTMLKRLKSDDKDFKIIDCDSNNHSLYERFKDNPEYAQHILRVNLLSGGEDSNLDYFKLQDFFDSLSEGKHREYYIDFGQDDSNALVKLIKNTGIDTLKEFLEEIKLDVDFCPVVAVPDGDSFSHLNNFISIVQGKFKIIVYANMLNAPKNTDFIDALAKNCKTAKIDLRFFNEGEMSDGMKSNIHNYLNTGFQTRLALAKGQFNKIVDNLDIS